MVTYQFHGKYSKWYACESGFTCGGAFEEEGVLIRSDTLASLFGQSTEPVLIQDRLLSLNGLWGIFLRIAPGVYLAAVDRLRTYPLFYAFHSDKGFFLSNNAESVREFVNDKEMDSISYEEYKHCCYVSEERTLYPNVKQIRAGEFLLIVENEGNVSITSHRWYTFNHKEPDNFSTDDLLKEYDTLVLDAHKRQNCSPKFGQV
jgi:hypothetical protein